MSAGYGSIASTGCRKLGIAELGKGHRLLSEHTLAAQQHNTCLKTPAQTPKTEDMNKCTTLAALLAKAV